MGGRRYFRSLLVGEVDNGADEGEAGEHGKGDLDPAPRPLALNLAGAGIDEELEILILKPVRTDPNRKQDIFESNVRVIGGLVVNALFVSADIVSDMISGSILLLAMSKPVRRSTV